MDPSRFNVPATGPVVDCAPLLRERWEPLDKLAPHTSPMFTASAVIRLAKRHHVVLDGQILHPGFEDREAAIDRLLDLVRRQKQRAEEVRNATVRG